MNKEDRKEQIVSGLSKFYGENQIDESIVSHLWSVQLICNIGDKPTLPKRISDVISIYKKYDSVDFSFLFKGVNKKLPMPVLIASLNDYRDLNTVDTEGVDFTSEDAEELSELVNIHFTEKHPACFVQNDEHVSFNPKNLVRYYWYSQIDAKNFHKSVSAYLRKSVGAVRLIKKASMPKDSYHVALFGNKEDKRRTCMWCLPRSEHSFLLDINRGEIVKTKKVSYTDLLEISYFPIPISYLEVWKMVAREWYKKNTNSTAPWDELSVSERKRHIVNSIRHNMIGYDIVWRNVRDIREIHDITFDRVIRQIMNAFPWLHDECKRQLDNLNHR